MTEGLDDLAAAQAHFHAGRFVEAEQAYRRSLAKNARSDAMNGLGTALARLRKLSEAKAAFSSAIQIQNDFLPAYQNLGRCCQLLNDFVDGEKVYRALVQRWPDNAEAYDHLAGMLREQKKFHEALAFSQTAVRLQPQHANYLFHLGLLHNDLFQLEPALKFLQQALAIDPTHSPAEREIAIVLWRNNRFDEAMATFNRLLARDPQYREAHEGRAELRLLMGDYERGWPDYELRWKNPKFNEWGFMKKHRPQGFLQPRWNGEDLRGKTLLLYGEQGFGDVIQFIRYGPLLAQRGAKVIFQCPYPIQSLMQRVEGIHRVIVHGEAEPSCDFYIPTMSVPALMHTTLDTVPARAPYLSVPQNLRDAWRATLSEYPAQFRVGLCWAGRPDHDNDARRSCDLTDFAPLADVQGVKFFSLQKGHAAAQAQNPPAGMELVNLTRKVSDFLDTAALIEQLDLVISVDTSIAHLAGALGRPVWTLLPFTAEWRWLHDRTDSPWYPTMRLFRQKTHGDWPGLFTEVAKELDKIMPNS